MYPIASNDRKDVMEVPPEIDGSKRESERLVCKLIDQGEISIDVT